MKNSSIKYLLFIFGIVLASSSCNKPASTFNIQKEKQFKNKRMKTIGLIGGTGWASSVEYYRLINELINKKQTP